MSIVLVRHGETALNAGRIVQPADTPLNERGLTQARALALRVSALGAARIVSSHLPRARMTADAVAIRTGLSVTYWEDLQERNFGVHRGTPYAELTENIFADDYVPAEGESGPVFRQRVAKVWARVVREAATVEGNLVVVTHGLVCRLVSDHVQYAAGVAPPERYGNTCISLIDAAAPHQVRLAACTRHLDGDASDDAKAVDGI